MSVIHMLRDSKVNEKGLKPTLTTGCGMTGRAWTTPDRPDDLCTTVWPTFVNCPMCKRIPALRALRNGPVDSDDLAKP